MASLSSYYLGLLTCPLIIWVFYLVLLLSGSFTLSSYHLGLFTLDGNLVKSC